MVSVGSAFLESATRRLLYYKELGDKTFVQLSDADFHFCPGEESNSIAVIIQHMYGNMLSRWTDFLSTDGEKEWRNRDAEFETTAASKEQLLVNWKQSWACCLNAIAAFTENDLLQIVIIRGEALTVVDAINRQLAHYPYHVGQIIFVAKMIKETQWQNLSVPRNKSGEYNEMQKQKK